MTIVRGSNWVSISVKAFNKRSLCLASQAPHTERVLRPGRVAHKNNGNSDPGSLASHLHKKNKHDNGTNRNAITNIV